MFQRLSCLPCVSYFALASQKSALAFQSLSCLPCVSYSFLVSAMYLPQTLLFAFHGTASSNAGFSFQSKGMTTLINDHLGVSLVHTCTSVHVPHYLQQVAKGFKIKRNSLSSSISINAKLFITCHVQSYVRARRRPTYTIAYYYYYYYYQF